MARKQTRLEDLARLAGVSTATISRALNDSPNVNQDTKRHIWRLAREHNYSFRPHMPAILSGASATIALVIPTPLGRESDISDPFYLELIGGVGDAAKEHDCDILISHLTPKTFDDLSGLVAANHANGVVFLGQSVLHDRFNRLAEEGHRFVVWGAELPGQKYCSIGSDNIRGGKRAVRHLIRLQRKKIAFIGDADALEVGQRYQGYAAALEEAGMALDPELVTPAKFELESAESAIDTMIARGVEFDALFAASDLIAVGAIRAIKRSGA
ncbi:MAG: LacI family DNA-binding transcriptional regulator [Pseudomonadota bacterium]